MPPPYQGGDCDGSIADTEKRTAFHTKPQGTETARKDRGGVPHRKDRSGGPAHHHSPSGGAVLKVVALQSSDRVFGRHGRCEGVSAVENCWTVCKAGQQGDLHPCPLDADKQGYLPTKVRKLSQIDL